MWTSDIDIRVIHTRRLCRCSVVGHFRFVTVYCWITWRWFWSVACLGNRCCSRFLYVYVLTVYYTQLTNIKHINTQPSNKTTVKYVNGKGKGLDTCYSTTYMSRTRDKQRFTISEVQLIGMSQWCRSALCENPLPSVTDNGTHGAAIRHTIAPITHTTPSPCSLSYYSLYRKTAHSLSKVV